MVGLHQLHHPPAATLLLVTIQASKKKTDLLSLGSWTVDDAQHWPKTEKTVQNCLKVPRK
jgi:hypothetical protein